MIFMLFLRMFFGVNSSHNYCVVSLHCFFVCEQKEVVYSMDQEKQSRVLAGMEQLKVTQMMITDPNALFYLTGNGFIPVNVSWDCCFQRITNLCLLLMNFFVPGRYRSCKAVLF